MAAKPVPWHTRAMSARCAKPRPPSLAPASFERAALAYLERFASSAANLERVLKRRLRRAGLAADDPAQRAALAVIAELVERYRRAGLLDDRAYAEAQSASLSRRGLGRRRIRERLAAKGVAAEDIEGALAELAADPAESELAAAVRLARRKRLGPFRAAAERRERRDKDLAALGRAG